MSTNDYVDSLGGDKALWLDYCKKVGSSTHMQSLLYDLNLLPEQIRDDKQAFYMCAVVTHIEELEDNYAGIQEDLAQIVRVAYENPNSLRQFVVDNYPRK